MSTVEQIVERFGGLTKMANELGHRNPTTVQGWRDRGIIPARQLGNVLEAAERKGIPLTPADLIAPAPPTERGAA